MKFKVGDKIIGLPSASGEYSITIHGWIGYINEIGIDSIRVSEDEGTEYGYYVDPSYFTLVNPKPKIYLSNQGTEAWY